MLSGDGRPRTLEDAKSALHYVSATKHIFALTPFLWKCQDCNYKLSLNYLVILYRQVSVTGRS